MSTIRGSCPLCGEPVAAGDDVRPVGGFAAHRECLLRAVVGGIGHHEAHDYWCTTMRDPDGGRTYRQSALAVDELIATRAAAPDDPEETT